VLLPKLQKWNNAYQFAIILPMLFKSLFEGGKYQEGDYFISLKYERKVRFAEKVVDFASKIHRKHKIN
jgi:hypothetical protein